MESAGRTCLYSSEWNKFSQKTCESQLRRGPRGRHHAGGGRRHPRPRRPRGGFPCQPFSIAGVSKKHSLGRATGFEDETHGTLFFDICRILDAKRPKAFFLENVKNLVRHDRGRTFKVIQSAIDELDYQLFYKVLDAQPNFCRKRSFSSLDFDTS